ncbi:juvenile hormone esterase-like [Plodia interpunctella]|uniref:juvenile hormone esterase-like n=1 Tax=Plodia interpunctella TaxID=58824 RepID=UPI0023681EB7|nr:juvenile hormone esterase-like [Plodia interpunctella]
MIIVIIGVFLVSSLADSANVRVDPLVLIHQGLVRGRRATDGDYSKFLGVPYAKVDLDNPFGPAEASPIFEEVIFNAYEGSTMCPQSDSSHSEEETLDCLKLNIYVPNYASYIDPLPVLLYLHGGDFSHGSAGGYGVKNLVKHGILVVTINYRLGPYGFMCLDVPTVPGNQGLKDQYLALQWIRRNINAFGGNPYNVTLGGQDAGAVSVLLHLYADKQKLYHKVIIESGTPQNEGMFVDADINAAIKLAEHLGLNTSNTQEALEFLTETPHTLVTGAAKDLNLQLKPCKERSFSGIENFIETDPYSLSNEIKISNTPILIGNTNKEQLSLDEFGDNYYETDPFYRKIENNFNLNEDQLIAVAQKIRNFYIGDKSISPEVASELEDFESDFIYNHPIQRTITKLLKENANPVYEYMFSYVGDSGLEGAGHSAELEYLFDFSNSEHNEKDQLIVDRITTLWANFVKYGNPTPQNTSIVAVTWSPVTSSIRPYLVIDSEVRMESRVFNNRMAFWDLFYDSFGTYNKLIRACSFY